ncbi:HTH-type transcriptional regulator [Sodalis praecaptivus]|uniref:HTH-type transcriptional regulator n=1 Tax=Sodalis praecaptivus TaxID=1239307 RepID=W0I0P1_9GAMM|nr:HTH-type transcriptional regulator SgrR [Sodalis praecaptivus]AHF78362.1 HTH-type transcriptional regulator [Sodalis praecaptivus]
MASPRLQQQFIRLWQSCQGESRDTTLSELALQLNCSRRHVRSLLKSMQHMGWLSWHSQPGRSKRSRLDFHYTGLGLQQQRASELLEQDRIDQLVQLVGDRESLRSMLLSHLGRGFRQGKHILRVLYYRPLSNLLPGTPLRRSDNHIVRQIFSGLTRINEENGELEADLAHHWQALAPDHWRFYLRPAVRFHHGREMTVDDVIQSLSRLTGNPLFASILSLHSPAPHTLDIKLAGRDDWLPWLLASVSAMILPAEWRTLPDFARRPVGTGPYSVVRNHPSQLTIRAFDDYFGYRALIDEVNIWVLPELSHELSYSGVQLQNVAMPPGEDGSSDAAAEIRQEEGCYFLLYDQRSPLMQRPEIRRWLCDYLNPLALLPYTPPASQHFWSPAYGLLPRWHHRRHEPPAAKPPELTRLTLTLYRNHSEFDVLAAALSALLAAQSIQLDINAVEYDQWYRGDATADIWLGSANFSLPLAFSLFATLYEIPLVHRCLPPTLHDAAERWRHRQLPMAEWCRSLVDEHGFHPLYHNWLSLQGSRSMRGIRMNTLGWFDFKSAWFAPPAP